MSQFWQRLTRRQRLLVLWLVALVLIVAVVLTYGDIPIGDLPWPARLEQQERRLEKLRTRLADLERQRQQREQRLAELQRTAKPFWDVGSKTATAEVRTELDKLLRHGQVTAQNIRLLHDKPEKFTEYVLSVEHTLQIRSSMREISRLLAELETAERPLLWTACTFTAEPAGDPKQVNLTGRIQALLLSPEAAKFIYGSKRTP